MSVKSLHNILSGFDSVSLNEMSPVALMNRVDTKYLLTRDELLRLLPSLTEHYAVLTINDKQISAYESLYYDDAHLSFYNDHHKKRLNRFKIRYRKYVDSNTSFLEIKHKFKGRTNKTRITSDALHMDLPEEHSRFINDSLKENQPDADALSPILINKYKRITLFEKNIHERLTIDMDLEYLWEDHRKTLSHLVIAELKQTRISRNSPFSKIMKSSCIRPFRLSKYCIGIIELYGKKEVKYGRFKNKLLKIEKLKTNASLEHFPS